MDIKKLKPIFRFGEKDLIDWFEISTYDSLTVIQNGLKNEVGVSPFNIYISVVGKNSYNSASKIFKDWWNGLDIEEEKIGDNVYHRAIFHNNR